MIYFIVQITISWNYFFFLQGKLYTSIEAQHSFNDFSVIPNSGMLLMANETTKMQTYYIPSLGPAPHWCSFLDNLTEELEELNYDIIYDDYKFVTEKELNELSLSHLKGTNLLRAYMHGYFMDMRLYRKAKDVMKPFEFEEYKRKRIRDKIKEEAVSRVQVSLSLILSLVITLLFVALYACTRAHTYQYFINFKKMKIGAKIAECESGASIETNGEYKC